MGIYKTHDATKSVTINPRMFSEAAASKGQLALRRSVGVSDDGGIGGGKVREKVVLGDATNVI